MLSEYLSCVRINFFRLYYERAYAIHHVTKSFICEFGGFSFFWGFSYCHFISSYTEDIFQQHTVHKKIPNILSTLEGFSRLTTQTNVMKSLKQLYTPLTMVSI
jgi:hypothetical protein